MGRKLEVTYLPSGKVAHVPDGTSVFNAAHWAGLPIDSTCGGRGTCGKCRVRIVRGAAERTLADYRHVPSEDMAEGWRLACQQEIHEDTECEVPALLRSPKAATMGVNRFVLLEPNVQKVFLELPEPGLDDPRSHLRRIRDALLDVGGIEVSANPRVLPAIADATADENLAVTATVVGDHLVDVEAGDTRERLFGISLDVGTTTVVATLVDLRSGAAAAVESTINRQAPYGADVIARIGHAMGGRDAVEELRAAIVDTVSGLVESVCSTAGAAREEVTEIVAVGNATMLHLLLGVDPRSIALSPFVATFLEAQDVRAADLGLTIHPEGRVDLFPSIGAYVGADVVGDIVATGLARDAERRLLVDVGTNGEIAVGNAERVLATSAPAGPAFEGGQILHGMRATEGAIEGVVLDADGVHLQVIGGDVTPRGICGSALIDIVAQLRLTGLIRPNGIFVPAEELLGHPLADRVIDREGIRAFALTDDVVLTQLDIRALAEAKAAISTGIEVVMDRIGLVADDLDEVMLAGSFGTYIDPGSARLIGLVPPVPVERISAVGNAASEGAKMALMSFREREVAFELPTFVEYEELSAVNDFNDRYIRNVSFPELRAVGVESSIAGWGA